MADEDEDVVEAGGADEKVKLLEKRMELVSLLRSVRHSLKVNGQAFLGETPFNGSDSKGAWLWSGGRFSERGPEKAHTFVETNTFLQDHGFRLVAAKFLRVTALYQRIR